MPSNIHDAFFKAMMANKYMAVDFLKAFLPADLRSHLDLSSFSHLENTFVDGDLSSAFSDAVFSCKLHDIDQDVMVTILLEHKSYKDESAAVQMLLYLGKAYYRQWNAGQKNSPIIPLLFFHGK